MPQGLQAWDASGNLVVDLGDYSTRFVSSHTVTIPAGTSQAQQIAVSGVTGSGHFAVITAANVSTVPDTLMTYYTAVTYDGGFWISPVYGAYPTQQTITVDIYAFT